MWSWSVSFLANIHTRSANYLEIICRFKDRGKSLVSLSFLYWLNAGGSWGIFQCAGWPAWQPVGTGLCGGGGGWDGATVPNSTTVLCTLLVTPKAFLQAHKIYATIERTTTKRTTMIAIAIFGWTMLTSSAKLERFVWNVKTVWLSWPNYVSLVFFLTRCILKGKKRNQRKRAILLYWRRLVFMSCLGGGHYRDGDKMSLSPLG